MKEFEDLHFEIKLQKIFGNISVDVEKDKNLSKNLVNLIN